MGVEGVGEDRVGKVAADRKQVLRHLVAHHDAAGLAGQEIAGERPVEKMRLVRDDVVQDRDDLASFLLQPPGHIAQRGREPGHPVPHHHEVR